MRIIILGNKLKISRIVLIRGGEAKMILSIYQ